MENYLTFHDLEDFKNVRFAQIRALTQQVAEDLEKAVDALYKSKKGGSDE